MQNSEKIKNSDMKIRNLMLMILAAAIALISCDNKDQSQPAPEYLDVNANNISGKWELVEWNGSALEAGTYVFLEIVRNDRSYKIYQNLDSFSDIPHVVTGSYNIETDPELGAYTSHDQIACRTDERR